MLVDEAIARSRAFMRSGNALEAARQLLAALEQSNLSDREYEPVLEPLARALESAGLARAAATVWLFLRRPVELHNVSAEQPKDLARGALIRDPADHRAAGELYVTARWPAHAAIEFERARDFVRARTLWDQVSSDPRLREDPYVSALVSFNMGRAMASLGDDTGAHRCRVRAVRLLEEAADVLEARGLRERAFDCFHVLLALGAETGSFENLAEGYLNCIRILKADHLKYYAIQYYEHFVAKAETSGEHHAAATILHEASEYARSLGMDFHGALRDREAQCWQRAADGVLASGGAPELAENALLAAVGAYTSVGMHAHAVQLFRTLGSLPLDEKRTGRYKGLAVKFADATDETLSVRSVPDYLKHTVQYPDIWNVDVIEWEEDGDAVETCGEMLLDREQPTFLRRRILLARLVPLMSPTPTSSDVQSALADRLGHVQLWSALSPLEHLYERGDVSVRAAVLRAARQLFFKRTFQIVQKAVVDPDASVRREATAAIQDLHFPHAFEPLQRLHRDSGDLDVRRAALESIGRIQSIEAVEYLINVLATGSVDERNAAKNLLARSDYQETGRALAAAIERETGEVQKTLLQVRRQRGDR